MKGRQRVLIVDDETYVRDSLAEVARTLGFDVTGVGSVAEARAQLASRPFDVILTDLRLPEGSGLDLLGEGGGVPVVVITGHGGVSDAVDAMKAGAYDFVQKPIEPEQLGLILSRGIQHRGLVEEVHSLRETVRDLRGPRLLAGASAPMARVRELIAQVAPTEATVLVTGESGTGKELVANEVHRLSARSTRSLVRVNCAAVPENLFESEFFGHRRGSFSGAVSDRKGRFAEAEGGTLVLDEIGTLHLDMQAKLLRVIESGEYQVVGESATSVADVRLVAITNEDLPALVADGRFRDDLYYRLNIFPIQLPPLRSHREDVPEIVEQLLVRARDGTWTRASGGANALDSDALAVLESYPWPGNVRELRNVLERALILASPGRPLDAALFRAILEPTLPLTGPDQPDAAGGDLNLRARLDMLERDLVQRALAQAGGVKKEASRMLGIDPRNLGYYLRKHDLQSEGRTR